MGDKPFKRKCLAKIEEIRQSGRTIFYVSHAAASVAKLCDRVIVLENGKMGFDGPTLEGIRYLKYDVGDDGEPEDLEGAEHEDAELGADI